MKKAFTTPRTNTFTEASVNALTHLKAIALIIYNHQFFEDKIYGNKEFCFDMKNNNNSTMLTSIKGIKGQTEWEKQYDIAHVDVFSKAVSTVRQPIEC